MYYKYLLFVVIFSFYAPCIIGQVELLDSLEVEIKTTKNTSDKLKAYIKYLETDKFYTKELAKRKGYKKEALKIAEDLNDIESIFEIEHHFSFTLLTNSLRKESGIGFEKCFKIATSENNIQMLVKANYGLGFYHSFQSNFDDSIEYYTKAGVLNENEVVKHLNHRIYNGLAVVYYFKNDYVKSYFYYDKGLEYALAYNDIYIAALIYGNLGNILVIERNYDKAISNYKKSLELLKKSGKPIRGNAYSNLGAAYFASKRYEEALEAFKLASLSHSDMNLNLPLRKVYADLGQCYLALKQYKTAVINFEKSFTFLDDNKLHYESVTANSKVGLAISRYYLDKKLAPDSYFKNIVNLVKDPETKSSICQIIARFYLDINKQNQAVTYLQEAYSIEKKHELATNSIITLNMLTEAFSELNNYKKAYEFSATSNALSNSVENLSDKNDIKTQSMFLKYEQEQKDNEKQIIENKLIIKNHENDILLKKTQALVIISGLSLIILIIIIYGMRFKYLQRINKDEVRSNLKIDRIQAIIEGEEHEKKQIAAYIHENLSQDIIAVRHKVASLKTKDIDKVTLDYALKNTASHLDTAISKLREISYNLAPPSLYYLNVVDVIEQYCIEVSKESGKGIHFKHLGLVIELPQEKQVAIYRIVQELLKNVVMHSNATEALVQITNTEKRLTILVEDNGTGYQNDWQEGLGWKRIKYRMAILKALHRIKTTKNGVTTSIEVDYEISVNAREYITRLNKAGIF